MDLLDVPFPAPPPVSVLAWESFVLLTVMCLDGTALLACREITSGSRRRAPGFDQSDQTIVLRLGDDHRAVAALAVLDDWQRRRSPLRVRPTEVPGAIESVDAAQTRIRAPLAAA